MATSEILDREQQDALASLRERSVLRGALPPPAERRRIRASAGVTVAELASALRCAVPSLRDWESGRRVPRVPAREEYAAALQFLSATSGLVEEVSQRDSPPLNP